MGFTFTKQPPTHWFFWSPRFSSLGLELCQYFLQTRSVRRRKCLRNFVVTPSIPWTWYLAR